MKAHIVKMVADEQPDLAMVYNAGATQDLLKMLFEHLLGVFGRGWRQGCQLGKFV
jgi:hypothetical protein